MGLLIDTLLKLEPTLVVQFYIYMFVAFGLGAVISAFALNKFHERDAERYRDGMANYERLNQELKDARAQITALNAKIKMMNQTLRQSQAFPPRDSGVSNPADSALFDVLSGQSG